MNRDQAKELIKSNYLFDYVNRITTKARAGGYICPLCGSGEGKNRSGAFMLSQNNTLWHCFSCDAGGDIFDLIGKYERIEGFNARLDRAAELYSITIDTPTGHAQGHQQPHRAAGATAGITAPTMQQEPPQTSQTPQSAAEGTTAAPAFDFTAYYTECLERLKNSKPAIDYLNSRGIALQTAIKCGIGFDPAADPASAPAGIGETKHPTPRLIIPFDSSHYLGRSIDPNTPKPFQKMNSKAINSDQPRAAFFNGLELDKPTTAPLFVTEGAFDALSLLEAGQAAIAINSTANVKGLLERITAKKITRPIIIALDSDSSGQGAAVKLAAGLDALHIDHYTPQLPPSCKDINELFQESRRDLDAYITDALEGSQRPAAERREEYYKTQSARGYIQDFVNEVQNSTLQDNYSTGFKGFDKAIDGGLYPGLYFIGAISSLGKTTFVMQIADQLAEAGKDVLIFSLEMPKKHLISKSISRLTYTISKEKGIPENSKTTRDILTGKRYKYYTPEEVQTIKEAIKQYSTFAEHIFIKTSDSRTTMQDIKETVLEHIRITGRRPVVFIDYLQIIAPGDFRKSDKQNTDDAVTELKLLSAQQDLIIVCISSFNRENYKDPVNLAAFKESGAIEYSSDVLIALQYLGMDYQTGESASARDQRIRDLNNSINAAARAGTPQKVQCKILKTRLAPRTDFIFDFIPKYNYFAESETQETTTTTTSALDQTAEGAAALTLEEAFEEAAQGTGSATLKEIANIMHTRQGALKEIIKENSDFVLKGNTVSKAELFV